MQVGRYTISQLEEPRSTGNELVLGLEAPPWLVSKRSEQQEQTRFDCCQLADCHSSSTIFLIVCVRLRVLAFQICPQIATRTPVHKPTPFVIHSKFGTLGTPGSLCLQKQLVISEEIKNNLVDSFY